MELRRIGNLGLTIFLLFDAGIAGSSGSGKTSVAMEIVKSLSLPHVVILVMVCSIWIFKRNCERSDLTNLPYRTHSTKR